MTLYKKIESYIQANNLVNRNETIIVGVSGGMDSMVLLDLLHKMRYPIVVAHVNFLLRNNESDNDEKFVVKIAQQRNLQIEKISFDTTQYAKEKRISIEMAARELRYEWFDKLSKKYNTNNIAVAHHADDNIETLLLNLIRGTGLKGLSGMKPRNNKVIRPLLSVYRCDIEEYAHENNIEYVTDSTNDENIYTRNKIRNQIIPMLEEINPSIKKTLNSNISNFQKNNSFYFYHIREIEKNISHQKEDIIYINIEKLLENSFPETILYEILTKYNFNSDTIENIFQHLNHQSGTQFLSSTHRLIKDRKYVLIEKRTSTKDTKHTIDKDTQQIKQPFHLKIKNIQRTSTFNFSTSNKIAHIDKEKLIFPIEIRRWQEGDTFKPIGMNGFKKISDFLIDLKINRFEKKNCWVLCNGNNDIIWVIGKRLDDRYKISSQTTEIIEFELVDSK